MNLFEIQITSTFFSERELQVLNLSKIQQFIDMGRLKPKEKSVIHMRDLLEAGIVTQVREGVKLLAKVYLICA